MFDHGAHIRPTLKARIKGYFLTGTLVILPLIFTIYLCYLTISWSGQLFEWFLVYIPYLKTIPRDGRIVLGFILLILLILATGFLASQIFGRRLIRLWERVLVQIPFVKIIYTTTKQFADTFFTSKNAFRQVVAMEYPRPGTYALGFLTSERTWRLSGGTTVLTVYIPNTPNPTGGRIFLVPPERLFDVDMTVEEALKLIVSGGMINPDRLQINQPLQSDGQCNPAPPAAE